MVSLTARESDIVFRIMGELSTDHSSHSLRTTIGPMLLDLLGAQYFASYVWSDETTTFDSRIALNMSDDNLKTYETYYQFRDPITPRLQRRRKTTAVSEIISRSALERSEFFNDFLVRDGLFFGINYYAYSAGQNIGDLRIWRGRGREDFCRRDLEIVDAIGPAFTHAMRRALAREGRSESRISVTTAIEHESMKVHLTNREKEIAAAVMLGKTDLQIAQELFISITTVRTHLKHLFRKLGVSSRAQLMHRIALH
ncbi:response regulator transcription factor [Hoeflea sp. TYP-13]|uniref:response regulator transcription factor n=1 Tax=Hoeflea sp. TYP-13 TaxID=3230023 RepID=UPI0034C66D4A